MSQSSCGNFCGACVYPESTELTKEEQFAFLEKKEEMLEERLESIRKLKESLKSDKSGKPVK